MFDSLTKRLSGIFEQLTKRGALKESHVEEALREIRTALLEADVALQVVKDFTAAVKQVATGQDVMRSVTPGQMVVKIVHDKLVEMLGTEDVEINLDGIPPAAILMIGLQGSGKTTTSAKLGLRLTKHLHKNVLMASLDIYRPAAQQQLALLGEQTGVRTLPAVLGEQPLAIAKRAMETGRLEGIDVVILDTAGRLHIDDKLMTEVAEVCTTVSPTETLLVTDAMTGQDAVNVAREFNEKVGVSSIVLTRVDGDARGGAALSMRAVTGRPIKLIGTGEKMEDLETFSAERIAGSILGMGDVVGLIEKASLVSSTTGGPGNVLMLVGADTGRDGIHGASGLASRTFDEDRELRPAVQVGNPFLEKVRAYYLHTEPRHRDLRGSESLSDCDCG